MQVRACEGISANPTALLQEILPDRNVKTKEMSQQTGRFITRQAFMKKERDR